MKNRTLRKSLWWIYVIPIVPIAVVLSIWMLVSMVLAETIERALDNMERVSRALKLYGWGHD